MRKRLIVLVVLMLVGVGSAAAASTRPSNTAGASFATSLPTAVVAAKAPMSLALDASRSVVAYGGSVTLTGSLANGQAGQSVTITGHRVPSVGGLSVEAVTTVQTAADGS